MIRKTTEIVASGDADTQWRRIRKSAEPCAEHPAERGILKWVVPGITLGRNMMVDSKYLNSKDDSDVWYYNFLLAHERAHVYQQKLLGRFGFYLRTLYEYMIKPGYRNHPYKNENCLEYWADQYGYLTP